MRRLRSPRILSGGVVTKHLIVPALLSLSLLSALTACGRNSPSPTPDTEATVAAAVAATTTAQAQFEGAVNAAVEATATAQALVSTPVPAAPAGEPTTAQSGAAAPTSTPVPAVASTPLPTVEYVTMTEEELAALIDEAVTATETYATDNATADSQVTTEEVETIEVYVSGAEEAIAYAAQLVEAYYEIYGELATEALDTLAAMEEDLAIIAENTAAINTTLEEISATLEAGLELAEETIAQLEAAADAAHAASQEVRAEVQEWRTAVQVDSQKRVEAVQKMQPSHVPANPQEALQSAFNYVDITRNALGDNKISKNELFDVAQAGANARAGLDRHGAPEVKKLNPSIDGATQQLARGDVPGARNTLGGLERGLPDRASAGVQSPSGSPGGAAPQPAGGVRPTGGGGGGSRPSSRGGRP